MKEEKLSEAIGEVEERFVEEMFNFDNRKLRRRRKWRHVAKAAACLLVVGVVLTVAVVGEYSNTPPTTVKSMEKRVKETVEELNQKLESGELEDSMLSIWSDFYHYRNTEYYRRLVGLGIEALPYISNEIEKNELGGIVGYLMASAVEEILHCDLSAITGKSWAYPEEFSQLWKSERNQVYADVRDVIHGNMETAKKEKKLKNFGLLILPYLYEEAMAVAAGKEPDLKAFPEDIQSFCRDFLKKNVVTEAELESIRNLIYPNSEAFSAEKELFGYNQYAAYVGMLTEKKELSVKLLADDKGKNVLALVNGIQVDLRKKSEFIAFEHCDITTVDWDNDGTQEILMVFRDNKVLDLRLLKLGSQGKWEVLRLPKGYRDRSINLTAMKGGQAKPAIIKPTWTNFETLISLPKIDQANREWLKKDEEISVKYEEDYKIKHRKNTLEISQFLYLGEDGECTGVIWQEFKLNKKGTALRYGKIGYRESA